MALAKDLVRIGMTAKEAHFLGETTDPNVLPSVGNGYKITATINRIPSSVLNGAVQLPVLDSFPNSKIVIRNDTFFQLFVRTQGTDVFSNGATTITQPANITSVYYKLSNTVWMVDV